MRIQTEHTAADQRFGLCATAGFDHADVDVAVLHRGRKVALLKGRTHALEFAGWHLAAKHQALGATADRAVQAAYMDLAGAQWRQ